MAQMFAESFYIIQSPFPAPLSMKIAPFSLSCAPGWLPVSHYSPVCISALTWQWVSSYHLPLPVDSNSSSRPSSFPPPAWGDSRAVPSLSASVTSTWSETRGTPASSTTAPPCSSGLSYRPSAPPTPGSYTSNRPSNGLTLHLICLLK